MYKSSLKKPEMYPRLPKPLAAEVYVVPMCLEEHWEIEKCNPAMKSSSCQKLILRIVNCTRFLLSALVVPEVLQVCTRIFQNNEVEGRFMEAINLW